MLLRPDLDSENSEEEEYLSIVGKVSIQQSVKAACQLAHLIDSTFDSRMLDPWWGHIQSRYRFFSS